MTKNGRKSVKSAAIAYNIPRTTLRHRLAGTRGKKGIVAIKGGGGGCNTALSSKDEECLVSCIQTMEKWGFGLTRQEILHIVQLYVKGNGIKTRFKDDRPGEDWYLAFSKRHNLSIKKPQGVEFARMGQVNPFVIYGFYDLLTKTVTDLQLNRKPHLIFNLDESSFSHDPSKAKVVGIKGVKSTRMISSPGRDNTSVLICCSAAGEKIPPLVIFKGKNVLENWMSGNETDKTYYAATKRGWMETAIFTKWFKKCFLPNISDERPVLLVFDGHSTHISPDLIEAALENQITILKLPPHTTHVLQPLDKAVFKSLKNGWEKELIKWQRGNPRQRIPKPIFVALLNRVYDNMEVDVIKNGFKATGIYDETCALDKGNPVNRYAVKEDIFRPEDMKEYKRFLLRKGDMQSTLVLPENVALQSNNHEVDLNTENYLNSQNANFEATTVKIIQQTEAEITETTSTSIDPKEKNVLAEYVVFQQSGLKILYSVL